MSYKVVLSYQDYHKPKRTIYDRLTLEEAQKICEDKESSWLTCTQKHLKRRTRERGAWMLIFMNTKLLDPKSAYEWMYENACMYESCTKLVEAYIYMRSSIRSGEQFYYVLDDPDHWIWNEGSKAWGIR